MLDAHTALTALRALGCAYQPDLAVQDGAWQARCPSCRGISTLRIRELQERTDANRNPPVSVGCTRSCTPPAEIAALLATDPELLEARALSKHWRRLAGRTLESFQRYVERDAEAHGVELELAA